MMALLSDDLQIAREAARAGAEVIAAKYGQAQKTGIKGDSQTLVSETDYAAEAAILEILREKSGYPILSEESGFSGTEAEGPRWIIDPLDGTSNFLRSLPFFGVSIGLTDKANPLLGVIIDPLHGNEYYAQKGKGAFCNHRPLKARTDGGADTVLFLNHGPRPQDRERYIEVTRRLLTGYHMRRLGSTALELCHVAGGSFHGFICSGDAVWDFAAGVAIAMEAGCLFTDWQGRPWDGKSSYVLVAPPEIHRLLIEKVGDIQKED